MPPGLSPRVRGNRTSSHHHPNNRGSIPACAGEPAISLLPRSPHHLYPRVCGGTCHSRVITRPLRGLSPRVRGNRVSLVPDVAPLRSIPACAGEPGQASPYPSMLTVYPRVCGGTGLVVPQSSHLRGLSPRVRGNQRRGAFRLVHERSIPACAGEPCTYCLRSCRDRLYPRVCGGTRRPTYKALEPPGLSPRVRGNLVKQAVDTLTERSIPACAGEPMTHPYRCRNQRVYPRVCGGPSGQPAVSILIKGLSPRVRGNLCFPSETSVGSRSIPACAGEPTAHGWRISPTTVYPRVCGGTQYQGRLLGIDIGLSPRVRGNP